MGLSANDPRPQHQQIADDLRNQIMSGQLAPGDRLPSTRELMATYGVYNQAVQGALKILQSENLTQGVPGRGTFVRQDLDLESFSHGGGTDGPSPDYIALSEKLDQLAATMQQLDERLGEVEARQRSSNRRSTTKSP